MLGRAGVTAMEERVAVVTVRLVLPEILPWVAVMVTAPAVAAVAKPLVSIWVHDEFDETQVTFGVISKLVPSEYVPVDVNRWLTPTDMLSVAGSYRYGREGCSIHRKGPAPQRYSLGWQ